jgi:cerevisin
LKRFNLTNGFAVSSKAVPLLALLKALPGVTVEDDILMSTTAIQTNAPWGLQRISTLSRVASSTGTLKERQPVWTYAYDENLAGKGVDVYVVDTGIRCTHVAFEGRALCPAEANFYDGGDNVDDNGHGTHCAGTVGSSLYGVSKKTGLVSVKVLGADGSGLTSGIILGIEYAMARAMATGRKSVISMSLGGGTSAALDSAVRMATANGVHVAVAAGNDNTDASNTSPARAAINSAVLCVGASDITDARAFFSNYGPAVSVFAPGLNVLSTWSGSDFDSRVISGTSMATPHVAGALAYFLSDPALSASTPAQLKQYLVSQSQKGALALGLTAQRRRVSRTTVNNLLHI